MQSRATNTIFALLVLAEMVGCVATGTPPSANMSSEPSGTQSTQQPSATSTSTSTAVATPSPAPTLPIRAGSISFVSERGDREGVFIIEANGGNLRRLMDNPAEYYVFPVFSPDG